MTGWVHSRCNLGGVLFIDRNCGEDYDLLRLMLWRAVHFVIRLRHNAHWVDEEVLPLSAATARRASPGEAECGWARPA